MADPARFRIGVDVGGTHTDLVLLDAKDGTIAIEKVASTPDDPARAVLDGMARFVAAGTAPEDIAFFGHGTTITTNAILQMRGAKVGLLITAGYRAVQEVQNQARDGNPFDYFYTKPEPIAPQSLTREIPGRIDYEGNELAPLDEAAVRLAARELRDANVDSIAVCFLFSFMNPGHERATRTILLDEFPGAHVSLSSEVLPRIREWPRLSTTLLNAYLEPVLVGYIANLAAGLDDAGIATPQRFLMQSNGGVMPFAAALTGGKTVHTLLSGPAAGARDDRVLQPRYHDHHQRAAADAGCQRRAADHRRLSRRPGGPEPGPRRQPVRLFLQQARSHRAAEPDPGDPGPHRLPGQRAGAARRKGCAPGSA